MVRFEYECPYCSNTIFGGIGDNVSCDLCKKSYETDYEYVTDDNLVAWLTGREVSYNAY